MIGCWMLRVSLHLYLDDNELVNPSVLLGSGAADGVINEQDNINNTFALNRMINRPHLIPVI